MRISPALTAVNIVLAVTLAGCKAVEYRPAQEAQSSSVAISSSASDDTSRVSGLFRDNAMNFVVIVATGKDKAAANDIARDFDAWVLPTDLTSNLAPGLYAVVYGPFADADLAKEKMEAFPYLTGRSSPTAYVKDAGAFRVPEGFERYAEALPLRILVAFAGRVRSVPLESIDLHVQWVENGGTLCQPTSSAYSFTAMQDGEVLRDSMSPNEIESLKQWTKETDLPKDQQQWSVNFDVVEDTGEVIGTSLCFD